MGIMDSTKIYKQNTTNDEGTGEDSQWKKLYPKGFFPELKQLICIAAPLIGQQLTMYMIGPIAVAFCGHLGNFQFDAVALSTSVLNIFGITTAVGLACACDTLFSQVYGSQGKHMLGIVLQRSLLILGLCALPCIAIFINAESLCLLLGQNHIVAKLTGDYMLVLIPGAIAFYIYICLLKYMQSQNIIIPTLVIGAIVNLTNILLHYLLVYVGNYGIIGSAVSQSFSYTLFLVLTLVYIICTGLYKATWNGWSTECLHSWGQFLKLAFFGLVMLGVEIWAFEGSIFLAGMLGIRDLAAQSLVLQVEVILFMVPFGNGIAASIRVGQFLGSGDAAAACTAARVAITYIIFTGLINGIGLVLLRDYLPRLFTDNVHVIELASQVFPIIALYMVFDSISGTCGGIIRGCGNQTYGAAVMCVEYGAALTIGIPLMFLTSLRIQGLWIGLAISIFFISFVLMREVYKTDWENETQRAFIRVQLELERERSNDEETRLLPTEIIPLDTIVKRRIILAVFFFAILLLGIVVRLNIILLDSLELKCQTSNGTDGCILPTGTPIVNNSSANEIFPTSIYNVTSV